jgi:hypothetical protein
MVSRRRLALLLAVGISIVGSAGRAPGEKPRSATLLKGPYLTGLSESGVDVRFELDAPSPARIEVRPDAADAAAPVVFEDGPSAMHQVRVSGLAAARLYSYAVRIAGRVVGEGRFSTAPSPESGAPLKFLVNGDNRSDTVVHAAVVRAMGAVPSDFIVNTGDMVEKGDSREDWQSFFDIEARLVRERPLFVAIGNHELYDDRAGANFARYFGFPGPASSQQPYGTVRLSNVRFFFLNAVHDWASGEERTWLERELSHADAEPGLVWRIAVMHQGPWSGGPHGGNAMFVRARGPELLEAHHIDLLFAGHDHIYERGEGNGGLKYVISGGGGAPLYTVSRAASTRKAEAVYHFVEVDTRTSSREEIHLVARRLDGTVLDECGFKKGGPWDCDAYAAADANAAAITVAGAGASQGLGGAASATSSPPFSSPTTRCGCASPGASGGGRASAGLVLSAVLAAMSLRRRGRRA